MRGTNKLDRGAQQQIGNQTNDPQQKGREPMRLQEWQRRVKRKTAAECDDRGEKTREAIKLRLERDEPSLAKASDGRRRTTRAGRPSQDEDPPVFGVLDVPEVENLIYQAMYGGNITVVAKGKLRYH